jgi:hypothetical protein
MPKPPVTLAEFKAHLNLDVANSTPTSDEEMWDAVLGATEQVEYECGPVRPRSQADRVCADWMGWGGTMLLPEFPVVSLTSVATTGGTAVDVSTLELNVRTGEVIGKSLIGRLDVVYVAGRHPIPRALMTANLILAKLQWATQRGPSAVNRFRGQGDTDAAGMSSGLDKYRADRLMDPYRIKRI